MIIPFRLSVKQQYTQIELETFIDKWKPVMVQEYGNPKTQFNPHWHGYIETDKTKQSLINSITKELHSHKDLYSLSTKKYKECGCDVSRYILYMCKGSLETSDVVPSQYYGITDSDVLTNHEMFHKNRVSEVKQKRTSKMSRRDELTKLVEYSLQQNHIQIQPQSKEKTILKTILQFHRDQDISLSNHQAELYYHYYSTKFIPTYLDSRLDNLYRRLTNIF